MICLMERFSSFKYDVYSSLDELSGEEALAVNAALKASERSYSPYSGFRVGASVLLETGETVGASNQESEVFPSGMCAERSLLYYYQSNLSDKKIKIMAIYSPDSTEKRQSCPFTVILASDHGGKIIRSAESLLPFCFSLPKK